MNDNLEVTWSEQERAEGERHRDAWEEFFSSMESENPTPESSLTEDTERPRIAEVLARYERELLQYPNVVGVAPGILTKQGKPTAEPCIVVYVQRKIPLGKLSTSETLPRKLDGIALDVVEIGMPVAF